MISASLPPEDREEVYRSAIERVTYSPYSYRYLAEVLDCSGQTEAAEAAYREAIEGEERFTIVVPSSSPN